MRRMILPLALIALALHLLAPGLPAGPASAAQAPGTAPKLPADDAASLELKRQQLVDKEARLKAKEDALHKLSASIDLRVNELNTAKKGIEESLIAKKRHDEERYKKMIKIYKALKPEEAGALLNQLDSKMVIEMLNQMDQKTAVKLIPFITQPRVLEWTRLSLQGK